GRVFAVYSGVLFGAASLGMAAAGGLLSSLNPRLVLFLAGGGGLVAAGVGALFYTRRHAPAPRSPQAPPAPAPDPPPRTPAPHPPGPPPHGGPRPRPPPPPPLARRTCPATGSCPPGGS